MKFKLEIDCDNAAFHDGSLDDVAWETSRILFELAETMRDFPDLNLNINLRDYYGNTVGKAEFIK